MSDKLRVGILGASGYGGLGLIERLSEHPGVRIVALQSRQYESKQVAECWPSLVRHPLATMRFRETEEVIEHADVFFTATPHGVTAPLVNQILAAGKRVVDLSADYRLDAGTFQTWYGTHPYPEHFESAVYGLPEFHRAELPGARLIASPGCNATAGTLALAPFAAAGILTAQIPAITVITGVTGAGRGIKQQFHFPELNENAYPYSAAGTHRHIAEIAMTTRRLQHTGTKALSSASPVETFPLTFTPHLVPMNRGIIASASFPAAATSTAEVLALLREFYAGDPQVVVQDELPQTKAVAHTDHALITGRYDEYAGTINTYVALDNLGKGASGQAVQAFNIAYGFAEDTALRRAGSWV